MISNSAIPFISDIANPAFDAQHFPTVAGEPAVLYHVMGRRNGFNSTVVLQDIAEFLAGDTLPELTGAENLELVSTSGNDAGGGSGTQSVQIRYLDTNSNLVHSAPITLNGLVPVAVPFKAKFIYAMAAYTGGASETSAGNILLRIAGGGATQEQITAGGNRSLTARFIVPTGWHAHIPGWSITAIGGGNEDARLRITKNLDGTLGTRYIFQDLAFANSGASATNLSLPWTSVPPMGKIKASTLPTVAAAGNRIDVSFWVLLMHATT